MLEQERLERARFKTASYHTDYYQKHDLFEPGSWLEKPDPALSAIIERGKTRAVKQALDLGCGVGRNAIPLAQAGWTVRCIDSLPLAISKLNANAKHFAVQHLIAPQCATIDTINIDADSFDLILMVSTVEHAESIARVADILRLASQGVKKSGEVLITVSTERTVINLATGQPLETEVETGMSKATAVTLLTDHFANWPQCKIEIDEYKETLPYDGQEVLWSSQEIRLLAQRES